MPGRYAQKHYLNPGSVHSLWEMYANEHRNDPEAVSKMTFFRAYTTTWKRIMPFRNIGQGKRCKECARLDEELKGALSSEEKDRIIAEKAKHVNEVMSDLAINVRENRMAGSSGSSGSSGSRVVSS